PFHFSSIDLEKQSMAIFMLYNLTQRRFCSTTFRNYVFSEILHSNRFYPYFKISLDCIGAIDGTYVKVKVPIADQPRFRGWKGTASDSKILKSALSRDDRLKISRDLFDTGFMLKHALITPYRGIRYHLKEFARYELENAYELFNLYHSFLRNVIEQSFGILRKRFEIIAGGTKSYYNMEVMVIVLACIILHNFLMGVDSNQYLITQGISEDYRRGAALRDNIMAQ
ncbi:hypothetical protein S245_048707, partial [Arachis hypogaea]